MKRRTAGREQRIGFAALAFILAILAGGAAVASDVERRIPVARDDAGSGVTVEISREGNRQIATPFLTLCNPTVQRIEDRIAKKTADLAPKEIPPAATTAGSSSSVATTGTPQGGSGRPESALSSPPQVPAEITVRAVRNILKGIRASRNEKPAPAVVVPLPEQRLGMVDAPPRVSN